MRNKFHIVGLRHYDWSGRIAEIFAPEATPDDTCIGQTLFLQHDPVCDSDPNAVMAWTLTEAVGHVSRAELPLIAGVFEQGGYEVVTVRIVGLDTLRNTLVVEPEDDLPKLPYTPPRHAPWTWDGPQLPLPMIWAKADHLARMMNLLAQGKMAWNDGMEEVVRLYMQHTVTDLSGDAYDARLRLAHTLLQNADPRLSERGHTLLAVMDHMGSPEKLTAWCSTLLPQLMDTREARSLASRYAEVEMQQMLAALRSFPFEIGREWLAGNGERFARRLYYAQMPRTDILKLLSLIVLYTSACRRMPGVVSQPAIGVTVGSGCHMSVGTLENRGTVMSIEQANMLPKM